MKKIKYLSNKAQEVEDRVLRFIGSTEDVDIINLVLSDHFREDYSLFINFLNIFSK